jgi:hypothetical protein
MRIAHVLLSRAKVLVKDIDFAVRMGGNANHHFTVLSLGGLPRPRTRQWRRTLKDVDHGHGGVGSFETPYIYLHYKQSLALASNHSKLS